MKKYYDMKNGIIIDSKYLTKRQVIKSISYDELSKEDLLTEKQYYKKSYNFLKKKYKRNYKNFYINLATGEVIKAKNKIQAFIAFKIDYKQYNLKVRFKDIENEAKRMIGSLRK